MLRVREHTPIPSFVVFTFRFTFESFKEFWSVSYYFKLRSKCISWPRVKVCLLFSNCWLISWSMSCFSVIVPSSPKLVPIFSNLDGFCIGGWPLGIATTVNFNVFICWIFDPKVFYNCSSFSQSSVVLVFSGSFFCYNINLTFWLLISTIKTMLTTTLSFFSFTWEALSWNIFCVIDLRG